MDERTENKDWKKKKIKVKDGQISRGKRRTEKSERNNDSGKEKDKT